MIFRRFYHAQLSQTSYLLGCSITKDAVVIDPNRDIDTYLTLANQEGLRIVAVTETHIHADFVSGARELASRTGAQLYLSGEGPETWSYTYLHEKNVTPLYDGDHLTIGTLRLDVIGTPGHTPEHLSFLVTNTAEANEPMDICTGDFLFVGDVGRPDLLEKAVGVTGTMKDAARSLFHSLHRLYDLADYLQIWPGHGAGSACGKALADVPQSTLGYEKRFNWAFTTSDEDRFVHTALEGQPEPPTYFAQMKQINRQGPALLDSLAQPEQLPADTLHTHLTGGATVVDVRAADLFAAGHVPGTLNIPFHGPFLKWSGWLLPYDRPLLLLGEEQDCREAIVQLRMIGFDAIKGFWGPKSITRWEDDGRQLAQIEQITVERLRTLLLQDEVTILDVREADEYAAGFIPTSRNIPLGMLPQDNTIQKDRAIVIHCQGGVRSAIGASLLTTQGYTPLFNLAGGFQAWQTAGSPVDHAQESIPS